ncbi:uncharacterized protein LOC34621418 [Cyclospora cayetanensis]|uniref:Uncharacterized protein LOC34621418 n=1 Tax=Cyclospora cayetanensis TaxID=88456 RepID=A0A6P6RW45_9EIME|nr:uncharacterized protein LOC34621418 [Cyclospora cayetanensis]
MSSSGMSLEELRAAARAAGLSAAEEKFVCFDWANSAAWQEYLVNLYPTPPLNRLLKWKKKFYKAHQDPSFDVNCVKVDQVLRGEVPSASNRPSSSYCPSGSPTFMRPVGNPPSAAALRFLSPLTLLCLSAGMLKITVAAATSGKDPMASFIVTGAFMLRLYSCFGLPPVKLWPLSQLGDSLANDGFPYFQQVLQNDAMHGTLFFLLTGLMPNSLPLMASPLITGSLVLAQILREGNGLPSFITNLRFMRSFTSFLDQKRYRALQLRADLEVYYGLFFFIWSLVRMQFSLSDFILPAYLYWQLQKLRYQMCPYSQASVRRVDGLILSFTSHPACPGVVRMIYDKIRNFCIRQVQPADTSSAARSSSCTIM